MREIERRQVLRRAVVAAGGAAAVWVVPTVVSVPVAAAASQVGSRPPKSPQFVHPPADQHPTATPVAPGELAFTGDDQTVKVLAAGGAIAAGVAITRAARTGGQPDWEET